MPIQIDLLHEERISPAQLARQECVHVSTVWRWIVRGVRGHRLAAGYIGGQKFTTRQAFQRFVADLNNAPGQPTIRTARQRSTRVERAEEELKKHGM